MNVTPRLSESAFVRLRAAMMLAHAKWDAQVGDRETLARRAFVIDRAEWSALAARAERLAAEVVELEERLFARPDLHARLGLPRSLRAAFASGTLASLGLARTLRFDFHPTATGYALSGVNSDVPGGFSEGSALPVLFAKACDGLEPLGDPARAWADAVVAGVPAGARVALVSAPGFLEDQQVVAYLAARLEERGASASVRSLGQVSFDARGVAQLGDSGPVDAIVRFFQAEWLAQLDEWPELVPLLVGGRTPVTNRGLSTLTESKRLLLAAPALGVRCEALRDAMPEVRDPRDAPWLRDPDHWVLKPSYGNTGDDVTFPDALTRRARALLYARVTAQPTRWVAQRRFACTRIPTEEGSLHVCVGVYTVDGRAAGAYVRATPDDRIDYAAIDFALLTEAVA